MSPPRAAPRCSAGLLPLADTAVLDRLRVGVRRGGRVRLEPPPDGTVVRRVLRNPEARRVSRCRPRRAPGASAQVQCPAPAPADPSTEEAASAPRPSHGGPASHRAPRRTIRVARLTGPPGAGSPDSRSTARRRPSQHLGVWVIVQRRRLETLNSVADIRTIALDGFTPPAPCALLPHTRWRRPLPTCTPSAAGTVAPPCEPPSPRRPARISRTLYSTRCRRRPASSGGPVSPRQDRARRETPLPWWVHRRPFLTTTNCWHRCDPKR